MAPKKTTKKLTGTRKNKLIEQLFNQHGNRRQFNVMDLGKISRAAETAYDAAATHDDGLVAADAAMRAACDKYAVKETSAQRDARVGVITQAMADEVDGRGKKSELAHPDPCVSAALKDAALEDAGGPADALDFRIPGLGF